MFLRIFKNSADVVASDDASLKIDQISTNSTKSGEMPSYGDDIKNTHVSKIGKYGERSGQREMMLGDKLSQIGALGLPVFIHSLKRHPRGPETVDGRAPKSGSRHYSASQHACYSHPTVVNIL